MKNSLLCILVQLRSKKIYYVPGTISLFGLPFLLFLFIPKEKAPLYCIQFVLASEDRSIPFSKYYFYRSIKEKKTIQIDISQEYPPEELYLFNAKLRFISRELESLQFKNDTSTVLKIKFGEANTYGHFIWVLNQALIYRLKRYVFVDNNFYLLPSSPAVFVELDTKSPSLLE
jgi:hypothetical protein